MGHGVAAGHKRHGPPRQLQAPLWPSSIPPDCPGLAQHPAACTSQPHAGRSCWRGRWPQVPRARSWWPVSMAWGICPHQTLSAVLGAAPLMWPWGQRGHRQCPHQRVPTCGFPSRGCPQGWSEPLPPLAPLQHCLGGLPGCPTAPYLLMTFHSHNSDSVTFLIRSTKDSQQSCVLFLYISSAGERR